MRYFLPDIRLSNELPQQLNFEEKLGGIPWGLRDEAWPKCRDCGKSQSLLAQFSHHPERLDLGRTGRILSIFQCNRSPGMCDTWDGASGANACFVTEPENLIAGLSSVPSDTPIIENEVRIVGWIEKDDDVSPSDEQKYYNWDDYAQIPESDIHKIAQSTKLGGIPAWIQSPDEAPKDGWKFAGQLDSTYSFLTAPTTRNPDIKPDIEQWEGRSHWCQGPNFGDGGIAYIFIRNITTNPEGWVFWQCG